jgi:hypothetical protein
MKPIVFLILVLIIPSGCRKEVKEEKVKAEEERKGEIEKGSKIKKNSIGLISDAYETGEIDYETNLLY